MTHPGRTAAAAMALALFAGFPARAGYDATQWGMTLAQVQKLYPGGVVHHRPTREDDYLVIRKVANFTTLSTFSFEKNALYQVVMVFPIGNIDLKTERFDFMTHEQSENLRHSLRETMVSLYGKPAGTLGDGDGWITAAGDMAILSTICTDESCVPTITYQHAEQMRKRSTQGL